MKKVSVAENCKQLLKHDYQQERLRKRVKKEGRSITNRYWHVRDIDEEMNESKYNTILFNKRDGVTFMDMYHFYTCWELGLAKAALWQVPCYCKHCNEQIEEHATLERDS